MRLHFDHLDEAVRRIDEDGFAVIEGVLTDAELQAVNRALEDHFPPVERFDPRSEEHAWLTTPQWGGLVWFPFANDALCNLVVHRRVVAIAEAFLQTSEVLLSRASLWAKYAGAGTEFDQISHFDFGNHTLVVPRQEPGFAQIEGFLYLEDVTEALGATRVVSKQVASYDPHARPDDYVEFTHPSRNRCPHLYEAEVPAEGPAGSFFAFTPDVLHRAAPVTAPAGRRVSVAVAFSPKGRPWLGYTAWPRLAEDQRMVEFLAQASPRQRELFGFPAVDDSYWTADTIAGVAARYPGFDAGPYEAAQRAR